jgi:hypothetical protein
MSGKEPQARERLPLEKSLKKYREGEIQKSLPDSLEKLDHCPFG